MERQMTTDQTQTLVAFDLMDQHAMGKARQSNPKIEKAIQASIIENLKQLGKSKNIGAILRTEKLFIGKDMVENIGNAQMHERLQQSMRGIYAAERSAEAVKSPETYKPVAEALAEHNQNRVGSIPKDAAREFFTAHNVTLVNAPRAGMDAEQKQIIELRKNNMRVAGREYQALQKQTMGFDTPKDQGQQQTAGMSR